MRIDTININLSLAAPSTLSAALMTAVRAKAAEQPAEPSADVRKFIGTAPAIGEIWEGQGGIYAGLSRGVDGEPDAHLILCTLAPKRMAWADAQQWAEGLIAGDHGELNDFHVPTRFESALLYANLRDLMETEGWYWTSTQNSDAVYAWCQYFYYGYQLTGYKSYEGRVRAVRRFIA